MDGYKFLIDRILKRDMVPLSLTKELLSALGIPYTETIILLCD